MGELLVELLLRLIKPALATVLGAVVWLVATVAFGAPPGPELAIGCWIAGACLVLLAQDGPI